MDARDRSFQAILPLRGKIINVEKARINKVLSNNEIQAMITAIGTGIGEEFNVDLARYHKVVLTCDADVDGAHIRTLILTFLFRHMKELIEAGLRVHRPAAAVPAEGRAATSATSRRSISSRIGWCASGWTRSRSPIATASRSS